MPHTKEAIVQPQITFDATTLGIALATLLFVAALIYIFVTKRKSRAKDTVMLTGLTGSGKTAMYTKLVTGGERTPTYTSLTENIACGIRIAGVEGNLVTLVDVPGNDRVRKARLVHWLGNDPAKSAVMGVIVVVDSNTFTKEARDVAELVYDVLARVDVTTPVLIVANKQDLQTAKSVKLISIQLGKELQMLHVSRIAALKMTDGDEGEQNLLPIEDDATFSWEDLARNVLFAECSCKVSAADSGDADHGDMKEVMVWLKNDLVISD